MIMRTQPIETIQKRECFFFVDLSYGKKNGPTMMMMVFVGVSDETAFAYHHQQL
jgi:hypothetical protein